jgi:curli production assembly/transport component CsgG
MKRLLILFAVVLLGGCALGQKAGIEYKPELAPNRMQKEFDSVPPPDGKKLSVAVYSFGDKTGQRKSMANIASLSSAVTQGAESYLIKALQDVGDARWFMVLERVGLDNLIKERQMIRQARELYQGKDAKPLPPMVFAGIIMEGGIVGYDSNTLTGGSGLRLFGIGASTQYQSDTVTVTLRTVSVQTGEILTTVTVTKTVLSYMDKLTLLRFVGDGTTLGANAIALEGETGGSINESINKAIDVAVQAAVVKTIQEGARKGHWAFRVEPKARLPMPELPVPTVPPSAVIVPEKPLEVKAESKVEEVKPEPVTKESPKNDMVPNNNEPEKEIKTETLPNKPNDGTGKGTSEADQPTASQASGTKYIKGNAFLHKEPKETSTKMWWVANQSAVNIIGYDPANTAWVEVINESKHRGWIKIDRLVDSK